MRQKKIKLEQEPHIASAKIELRSKDACWMLFKGRTTLTRTIHTGESQQQLNLDTFKWH